eukprot:285938-Pelagomonas_calceolata.AAC.3
MQEAKARGTSLPASMLFSCLQSSSDHTSLYQLFPCVFTPPKGCLLPLWLCNGEDEAGHRAVTLWLRTQGRTMLNLDTEDWGEIFIGTWKMGKQIHPRGLLPHLCGTPLCRGPNSALWRLCKAKPEFMQAQQLLRWGRGQPAAAHHAHREYWRGHGLQLLPIFGACACQCHVAGGVLLCLLKLSGKQA